MKGKRGRKNAASDVNLGVTASGIYSHLDQRLDQGDG